jgi:outer membrane protein assembly factor BamB
MATSRCKHPRPGIRRSIGRPGLATITATAIMFGLAGCLAPTLSESSPRHPGHGVAWLLRRSLNMNFAVGDSAIETVAVSGKYLVDFLEVPGSGEAYGRIGPTVTVRDLASGRTLWTFGSISGMPAVTARTLYIGKSGYDLRTGRQFGIPVRIPPGSVPDPAGGGLLVIAGPRAHRSLVSLNPRTGFTRWRVPSRSRFWFCGQIAASRAALAVMRCGISGRGQYAYVVVKELDCFDPVTGRLRWKHPLIRGVLPLSQVLVTVAGRTVVAAERPDGPWSAMDARTGATLPGLTRLSNWLRTHQQHAFLGLGPGRTAVLAESYPDDRALRSLHVIDLTDGRLLWTTPVRHPLDRVTVGVTHRMLYELNGSELTAYSLRSGAAIGHLSLPVTFAGDAPGLNAELVPGRAKDPAELIAGSQHEALLANGLLVARTRGSGLAAIRIGKLVR